MEESKALHRLIEAADLVGMVEDLLNPNTADKLSASAWSGLRITLRNIRESIQTSHSALAADLVQRSRASLGGSNGNGIVDTAEQATHFSMKAEAKSLSAQAPVMTDGNKIQMTRRDLKASLEKFIDR